MKPLLIFIITLLIAGGLTFILDMPIIYNNWLRYGLITVFILAVIAIGFKWTFQEIKNLK